MPGSKWHLILPFLVLLSSAALAQETDISGRVSVELNAVETVETSCKLTFLITNGVAQAIDKVVYEAVLFDANGQVDRLTLISAACRQHARGCASLSCLSCLVKR